MEDRLVKKNELLELLKNYFSQLYHHPRLQKDLLDLLARSGLEKDVLLVLLMQLSKYDDLGRAQAEQLHDFEPIDQRLYSMHVSKGNKFNIRILYAYLDDNKQRVLLHAFWERTSSDYQKAIPVAYSRLRELEEESV